MENYYIIMIAILLLLAITDLIVGVSNDAINFLNSAIGSKAFSIRKILIVASLGVLAGAVSSSGMMEVARKGIFSPAMFTFDEIIILFMAVMITDVLLLDLFNTLGLPTSTTVSIVFELLGASVALALIKINSSDTLHIDQMGEFINSGKALLIITGILLSVVIAFTIGAIVQYISRLMFSFHFEKNIPYFGALFGGFAITAIIYFILIKGLKGTDIKHTEFYQENLKYLFTKGLSWFILGSFMFFTIVSQLLYKLFNFNILKFIVIIGTFSLAMAFAGNDLVNFIGVPIAGFQSFEQWSASGVSPELFSMKQLAGKVPTPTIFLLLAGGIMVLTIWFSKKARYVIDTEINLARQDEGSERFHSNLFSRSIVRLSVSITNGVSRILPTKVKKNIEQRFERPIIKLSKKEKDALPAFDLIRASVNLVVAGILISVATSFKLPLSTTYVTFMVAMGTSLADRAWNRESAVYRIAGVVNVIGGWFMTALVAFSSAALVAYIIHMGSKIGGTIGTLVTVIILASVAAFVLLYRIIFPKKKPKEDIALIEISDSITNVDEFIAKSTSNISSILKNISSLYRMSVKGFVKEDLSLLKKVAKKTKKLDAKVKKLKSSVHYVIHDLNVISLEAGSQYVQVADYMREISNNIAHIVYPMKEHIDNNHKPFISEQIDELKELSKLLNELYISVKQVAENTPKILEKSEEKLINDNQQYIIKYTDKLRKKQIKRIKKDEVGTRNSMMYLSILNETKSLMLHTGNIVKTLRDLSIASSSDSDSDTSYSIE